ncbi:unnamed protein product [Cochlearia groenlandica]
MVSEKVKAEENKKSSSSFLKKKKPIKSSLCGSRPEPLKKKIDEDKDKKTVIEWNSSVSVSKEQVLNKKSEKEVEKKSSSSFLKKKPTNTNNAVSRKAILITNPLKKKEIESEKLYSEWNSSVAISKDQVSKKRKNIKTEKEEVEVKKQKEKKVYDIAGQKRDQPDERDPLRIFYETLYKEVPTCKMAQIWLMESGLLPAEKAKEDVEKSGKSSSLAKSAASTARANSKPVTVKKDAKKSSALLSKKKISDSKPTAKKRKSEQEGDLLASRASKISKTK